MGPVAVFDDGANTSYNAMLLSLDHRLSRNFSMLLNYTWSHCLSDGDGDPGIGGGYQNPDDRRAEHGNCSTDQRQMFNASVIAMSPRFQDAWAQRLLGDWQLRESSPSVRASGSTPSRDATTR